MTDALYHLATQADWDARDETYAPGQFAAEGFIHLSTPSQIAGVAVRFYRNRDDLLLLTIDPARLGPPVRYENLEGGDTLFPHLYGPLDASAVLAAQTVRIDADGAILSGTGEPMRFEAGETHGESRRP